MNNLSYDKKCTILNLTKILRFEIYQKPLDFVTISNLRFCFLKLWLRRSLI